MYDPRIWHSRGYIPHIDVGEITQFITFRLADSMPQEVLKRWRSDLESGEITDADFRRRIETYLDQNYGSSVLRDRRIAMLVQETLLKWDGERYRLIAWVIMHNHVHILIQSIAGYAISDIMHSIKSYTAHEANKLLGRKGSFWFKEYFDRYIRDGRHFAATVRYIEQNPVKARLCRSPMNGNSAARITKTLVDWNSLTVTQAPSPARSRKRSNSLASRNINVLTNACRRGRLFFDKTL